MDEVSVRVFSFFGDGSSLTPIAGCRFKKEKIFSEDCSFLGDASVSVTLERELLSISWIHVSRHRNNMLHHEHIITALTESFMSVYHSGNVANESIDNLNDIVMERQRDFERFVLGNEEKEQRHCSKEISQESDSEEDKTVRQKMFKGLSSVQKRVEKEIPQATISVVGTEVMGWSEYKDDNIILKYNTKSIKNVRVTFSLVKKPEKTKQSTKNEVDAGSGSSDSKNQKEIGHSKNTLFGYQVEQHGREDTRKESLDRNSLSTGSHVLGVCNCKTGVFCREAVAMKSETHQFLLATAKRYIKDENKKITLVDFIDRFLKQIPDHLQDYFLQKVRSLQMYIESKVNVEYLVYCIYNMLHIIYEECVHMDNKTSDQISVTFISEVLVNFWHYDGKKLHLRKLGNRDGLLGEGSNQSIIILYPSEINLSEVGLGSKYDGLNEPIRKWLKEIAEICYNTDGCLERDNYELIENAFDGVKSPELHRGVCQYIELAVTRSISLNDVDIQIENAWKALQNAMNMCRISDEKLGFKDLNAVFVGLSRIVPSPCNYEIFLEMQKARRKTEKPTKHYEEKKMEYDNDLFVEIISLSNNTENLVRNHMNTFDCSEQVNNFRFMTKSSKNSAVKFPKESRDMHPQLHSAEAKLSGNAGTYLPNPSHDEKYEGARCRCLSPSDENAFLKSMLSKCRVKEVRDMYDVLPLNYLWSTYGLAEELVSKGSAINDYYILLAEIVHSNGLPTYLRNYSKFESLLSNVQHSGTKKRKANVVYDWLLLILKECVDKDEGKHGLHCDNVIKQFNDLKWSLKRRNRVEPTLNFRPNAKLGLENLKLEQANRKVMGPDGSGENKSKRKDNRKTCVVSSPTTVLGDSEEKMESESIDIPCPPSSMENICDELEATYDAAGSCGSSKDHTEAAIKVIHKIMANKIKEHPSKSFVEQADSAMETNDSEKILKPVNIEKDYDNECDMLEAIETDTDEEYSPNQSSSMRRFEPIDLNGCLTSKRK